MNTDPGMYPRRACASGHIISLCLENAGQTPKHPGHPSSMQDGLIHCSELNRSMQEMMGHYIKLEEYYMIQSVKKVVISVL